MSDGRENPLGTAVARAERRGGSCRSMLWPLGGHSQSQRICFPALTGTLLLDSNVKGNSCPDSTPFPWEPPLDSWLGTISVILCPLPLLGSARQKLLHWQLQVVKPRLCLALASLVLDCSVLQQPSESCHAGGDDFTLPGTLSSAQESAWRAGSACSFQRQSGAW